MPSPAEEFEEYGSVGARAPAAISASPSSTASVVGAVVAGLLATTQPTIEAITGLSDDTTVRLAVQAAAPSEALPIDRDDLQAIAQIREFRSRAVGWKGPGSVPPSDSAVDEAEELLRVYFAAGDVLRPHIGLAADGEIIFFWETPQVTIDLSLTGDGTYAFFAKTATGETFFEDSAPSRQQLPAKLLRLLQTKV